MSTPAPQSPPPAGDGFLRLSDSSWKILQISCLVIATLVGNWMISEVINEREYRQSEVGREFVRSWGPEQFVDTPVLVIPYTVEDEKVTYRRYLNVAPRSLKTTVRLAPETRRRGLFSATVFGANVEAQGDFDIPNAVKLGELVGKNGTAHWAESFVMLATSDLSGMTPKDSFLWNGKDLRWQNCREVNQGNQCGPSPILAARLPMGIQELAGTTVPFGATATLRGTASYSQYFRAKEMDVTLAAPWPTPSFTGNRLPESHRISAKDFSAHWQTAEYSAPQVWSSSEVFEDFSSEAAVAGVTLLEATPIYRMIHRASKYDTLFVILAFTTYFLFELLSGIRIHMVQYGLLGASLTLFGLLLISFSEPLGYTLGYLSSAGLVLLQASLYTAAIARRPLLAMIFAAVLAFLFGFLYAVLSLESYALLAGSIALFVVLSLVMLLTQRMDWSTGQRT